MATIRQALNETIERGKNVPYFLYLFPKVQRYLLSEYRIFHPIENVEQIHIIHRYHQFKKFTKNIQSIDSCPLNLLRKFLPRAIAKSQPLKTGQKSI
jgi:hypothetical protein